MHWPHFVRALGHRNFRLYFSGQAVSLLGTWMQNVAISWLAYRLGNLVWLLGAISFLQQIPMLFVAPFAGAILDRVDRLRLLRVTQALSMLPAFAAAWLAHTGHASIGEFMVIALALGLINSIDVPARQSLIVSLIDDPAVLPNAIAMNSLAVNAARLIGPAIGGVLIAAVGEEACFLVNGVSYIAVVAALLKVRIERKPPPAARVGLGITEGFRYAARRSSIRTLLCMVALTSLLVAPYSVLMPVYARDVFHGDSRTLGLLLASAGAGALAASVFLLSRPHLGAVTRALRWSAAFAGLAVAVFSHLTRLMLAAPVLAAVGFCMIVAIAACSTLIQSLVPDHLRGRVSALYVACFIGLAPVGSLLLSSLASRIGVADTLLASGLLECALALVVGRGLSSIPAELSAHQGLYIPANREETPCDAPAR